eukprot:364277-Chlamydomonas_euryale.AAC.15
MACVLHQTTEALHYLKTSGGMELRSGSLHLWHRLQSRHDPNCAMPSHNTVWHFFRTCEDVPLRVLDCQQRLWTRAYSTPVGGWGRCGLLEMGAAPAQAGSGVRLCYVWLGYESCLQDGCVDLNDEDGNGKGSPPRMALNAPGQFD